MPTSPSLGTLYVVATPIGNLEDLTDRARRVLAEVDLIASEDTRRTRTLLSQLGLNTPLLAYHQHTEREKAGELLELLRSGRSVALVSDAGVPVISDPGAHLISRAWQEGIPVCPVPGPSALLSALCVSGFSADRFAFAGYPPRRSVERQAFYRDLAASPVPVVLYEAPHRLRESLDDAACALGPSRELLIAREMTKRFEQFLRAPLSELRAHFETTEPIGEFTLVIAPTAAHPGAAAPSGDPHRAAELLAETDLPAKRAAEILATATGLSRNESYRLVIEARKLRS